MQDVIDAYEGIERAREKYRETIRAAIADGVKQSTIARALGQTRESVRRAALSTEQRDEINRRQAAKARDFRQQKTKN